MDLTSTETTGGPGTLRYVTWISVVAALGGLLFGYDTAVISGSIGFLRTYFVLDAPEMGWAASSALMGSILGAGIAGMLSDRFGRKNVLILAAVLFSVSALWSALPRTFTEFATARIIGGVGVGMASMLSPLYIAEVAPADRRGRLVSFNQFAIVIGILVVYFVNYFIALQGDDAWNVQFGWRWMFGSEAIPAVLFLLLLFLVPESPRWLAKQGRDVQSLAVLSRVTGEERAEAELKAIREAIREEGRTTAQLLQPGMRRTLIIGITLAILQQVTGINVFMYYAPEIFRQLGSGTSAALLQTIVIGAVNLTFTIVALKTIDRLGRTRLMVIGSTGMGIALTALGLAAYFQKAELWVLLFILGYIACFALSMGPVVWVVLSEIFPTRIRGRAMAIATLALWSANYVVSQTFPLINENPWLVRTFHHAFPFWLYAFFCAVTIVFVITYIPETKGKTLEEIEKLWKRE
ncbi:MAG: sugar porter family MFS transporter [Ignavibacteria bacterium]|nr:sugar porter family MFS transporter [Ignavibacteria bacterium]